MKTDKKRNVKKQNAVQTASGKIPKTILFVSVLSTFITSFMGSALTLAVPQISSQFGLSAQDAGWIVTAYMLTCTSLAVLFGRLADIVDRKRILVCGLAVFAAGSLAGGCSPSMGFFLISRMVQGAGTAMIYSTSMSVLVRSCPEQERGKILGISSAATYTGLSAGPVLGGILTGNLGWNSVFFAAAGIAVLTLAAAAFGIPRQAEPGFVRRTWPSAGSCFLYVLSVSGVIAGLSLVPEKIWGWILAAAGSAGMVWYVFRTGKSKSAVLPVRLFYRRPVFLLSGLASMISCGTIFVLNYELSIYLQEVRGFAAQAAGWVLIVLPLVQAVLSPLTGKLSDRLSGHVLSAAGMAGTAACAAGFAFLGGTTPLWMIFAGLAAAGISCAFFAAPNTNLVMAAGGTENYSITAAVLSTLRSLGHSLSMAAAGFAAYICLGTGSLSGAPPEAVIQSMQYTCNFFFVLCIAGILMAGWKKV